MSELDIHTIRILPGGNVGGTVYSAAPVQQDRLTLGMMFAVANGSGGAGATVTVAVLWTGSPLPSNGYYFVDYDLPADYTVFTTAKTAAGFTVNIQPRLAANSVAAGTFNLQVSY